MGSNLLKEELNSISRGLLHLFLKEPTSLLSQCKLMDLSLEKIKLCDRIRTLIVKLHYLEESLVLAVTVSTIVRGGRHTVVEGMRWSSKATSRVALHVMVRDEVWWLIVCFSLL